MKAAVIPEVKQRLYCATCHLPTGTATYPARVVHIADDDQPNIPQQIALCHYSRCPDHT